MFQVSIATEQSLKVVFRLTGLCWAICGFELTIFQYRLCHQSLVKICGNRFQSNLNTNTIFIQENEFENDICKMAAILSQPHCVKAQKLPLCHYISCMSILQACWHMHFYVLFICQYVDMHHCSCLSIHQNWHLYINILTHLGWILFIPLTQWSCWEVYWFHPIRPSLPPSVYLSCLPCPLCGSLPSSRSYSYVAEIQPMRAQCVAYHFHIPFLIG